MLSLLIYLVKTELIDRIKPRAKQPGIRSITRPPGNTAILVAYSAAVKMLARKDLIRSAYMTTVEFNAVVNALPTASAIGTALTELTDLHDRYYYGMETAPPEEVQRAQNALGHLKEALRHYKADSIRAPRSLKRGTV